MSSTSFELKKNGRSTNFIGPVKIFSLSDIRIIISSFSPVVLVSGLSYRFCLLSIELGESESGYINSLDLRLTNGHYDVYRFRCRPFFG